MASIKIKLQKIWIDADACPKAVKEIVFKATFRVKIPLMLVANSYLTIPHSDLIRLIIVGKGTDVADQYIVDHVEAHDLVITADIPLAAKVVEKNAIALNPRGEIYTEENIGEILSMRDFMKDLRDGGSITGGPAVFGPRDVQQFANSLNKLLS
ncbi:MAG: YaiI/YqxD family protein [Bacteriovorax sp.]